MTDEQLQKEWREIVINKLNNIEAEQKVMQKSLSDNVIVANDVKAVVNRVDKIENSLENDYVTKKEFGLIEKIVYGAAGVILLTVLGALVALVVKSH